MDVIAPFSYEPLTPEQHQIRLVQLKPAKDGPIEGLMITQSLDQGNFKPYEAVSYVWGGVDRPEKILINGSELPITRSAFHLLSRLRRAKHQYLWLDAICISQEDDDERSHQVQQMRRVYASARRVIFYLGEPTPDTDLLMKGLRNAQKLHRMAGQKPWTQQREELTKKAWKTDQLEFRKRYSVAEQRQRNALHLLLRRPWFERVWIIQEVCNAKEGIVQCGDWAVSCPVFVLAHELLGVEVTDHCQHILQAMPSLRREQSWLANLDHQDLLLLLQRFRGAKAKLDCDKIYALLGLLPQPVSGGYQVDYKRTDDEVMQYTAAYLCECSVTNLSGNLPTTIQSFLDSLSTLKQSVLSQIVRSRHWSALEDATRMLQTKSSDLCITTAILEDAAKNEEIGSQMTGLLLEHASSIPISTRVLERAFRNRRQGRSLAQLLFQKHGDRIELTQQLAMCVASNETQGHEIAQVVIQQCSQNRIGKERPFLRDLERAGALAKVYATFRELGAPIPVLHEGPSVLLDRFDCHARDNNELFLKTGDWHFIAQPLLLALAVRLSSSYHKPMELTLSYFKDDGRSCPEQLLPLVMNNSQYTYEYLDTTERFYDNNTMAETVRISQDHSLWQFLSEKLPAAKPDQMVDTGQPSLWWAVHHGYSQLAESLIHKGARLEVESPLFLTPMVHAVARGDLAMVRVFLAHGIDSSRWSSCHSQTDPLAVAAELGHTEILELLINHSRRAYGAALYCGCTLLDHALWKGQLQTYKFLHKHGIQVDFRQWYKKKRCRLLFSACAGTNVLHRTYRSEFMRSMYTLYSPAFMAYILKGVDDVGRTNLLFSAISKADSQMIHGLLDQRVDVNAIDDKGRTPLHHAVLKSSESISEILLGYDADISLKDLEGKTPLDVAVGVFSVTFKYILQQHHRRNLPRT